MPPPRALLGAFRGTKGGGVLTPPRVVRRVDSLPKGESGEDLEFINPLMELITEHDNNSINIIS